jgi:hypothetical protein
MIGLVLPARAGTILGIRETVAAEPHTLQGWEERRPETLKKGPRVALEQKTGIGLVIP